MYKVSRGSRKLLLLLSISKIGLTLDMDTSSVSTSFAIQGVEFKSGSSKPSEIILKDSRSDTKTWQSGVSISGTKFNPPELILYSGLPVSPVSRFEFLDDSCSDDERDRQDM